MRWPGDAFSRCTALHLEVVRISEKYHIFEGSACRRTPSGKAKKGMKYLSSTGSDLARRVPSRICGSEPLTSASIANRSDIRFRARPAAGERLRRNSLHRSRRVCANRSPA